VVAHLLTMLKCPCRNYRDFLGASLGQNLEGRQVDSEAAYVDAVTQLRTPEVRACSCPACASVTKAIAVQRHSGLVLSLFYANQC